MGSGFLFFITRYKAACTVKQMVHATLLNTINDYTQHSRNNNQQYGIELFLHQRLGNKHDSSKYNRQCQRFPIETESASQAETVVQDHINAGCQYDAYDAGLQAAQDGLDVFILQQRFQLLLF